VGEQVGEQVGEWITYDGRGEVHKVTRFGAKRTARG
jgi:hypothetical protein